MLPVCWRPPTYLKDWKVCAMVKRPSTLNGHASIFTSKGSLHQVCIYIFIWYMPCKLLDGHPLIKWSNRSLIMDFIWGLSSPTRTCRRVPLLPLISSIFVTTFLEGSQAEATNPLWWWAGCLFHVHIHWWKINEPTCSQPCCNGMIYIYINKYHNPNVYPFCLYLESILMHVLLKIC